MVKVCVEATHREYDLVSTCRLSESNMHSIGSQIEQLYCDNSRNGSLCSTHV